MQEVTVNVEEQKVQLQEIQDNFGNLYNEINRVDEVAKSIGQQTTVLDELKTVVTETMYNLGNIIAPNAGYIFLLNHEKKRSIIIPERFYFMQ